MSKDYVIEMRNIEKDYSGNKVLKGINISAKAGEIHGILGENGAGKSTLMNILFGMPVIHSTGGYNGDIIIEGNRVSIKSPKDAMDLGIGMVHQEFMLIPSFTVTENIKLNREVPKDSFINSRVGRDLKILDFERMGRDSRKALDTLGMDIDQWMVVEGLPIGYKQFIEIAREIDKKNIKLLVFDEPTAVLTESEADNLLATMKKLAQRGIAILFITHRLDEIMSIADNITILRDGELVKTIEKEQTNVMELAELMVGRKIERIIKGQGDKLQQLGREVLMAIRDLKVDMAGEEVKGVNLDIYRGEILGIGGLAGQGKIGIANGIMGIHPAEGKVVFNGETLKLNNPKFSLSKGLGFVSEDRRGVGLLLDTSIELNIVLTAMEVKGVFLRNFLLFTQINRGKVRKHALKMIKDLDIRCTGPGQITRRLSGGNQQKVCIARALTLEPKILFVSEPTRGIDVGAKKLVLETLVQLNQRLGMTIVMTSSELGELRSICDRIAIISGGKVEGILKPEDSDAEFGLMMAGEYHKVRSKGAV